MAEPAASTWTFGSTPPSDAPRHSGIEEKLPDGGGDKDYLGRFFGGLDVAGWAAEATPEREWIVRNFVPTSLLTFLTGEGQVGKSLLMQQLCTCVATGRPFLGYDVSPGRALYVTAEDDPNELHKRQKAISETLGVRLEEVGKGLAVRSLVDYGGDVALSRWQEAVAQEIGSKPAGMRATPLMDDIVHQIAAEKHRLVVLDNASHFFSGNENDRHDVASFLRMLSAVCVRTGCAIVLVGFPNKKDDEFSGSTAWSNQVRSRLYVERPAKDVDPDRLRLRNSKANYAERDQSIEFRWHNLSYVLDRDLDVGMREALRETAATSADNQTFLDCLDALEKQNRTVIATRATGYAPKTMEDMPIARHRGVTKERLQRAMERLLANGEIEVAVIGKDAAGRERKALRRARP